MRRALYRILIPHIISDKPLVEPVLLLVLEVEEGVEVLQLVDESPFPANGGAALREPLVDDGFWPGGKFVFFHDTGASLPCAEKVAKRGPTGGRGRVRACETAFQIERPLAVTARP